MPASCRSHSTRAKWRRGWVPAPDRPAPTVGVAKQEDEATTDGDVAPHWALHWRTTLWAMVGIQFIMTMSFSFLSPIMPLFLPELGVTTDAGIYLWSGILNGSTSFVAAFAS